MHFILHLYPNLSGALNPITKEHLLFCQRKAGLNKGNLCLERFRTYLGKNDFLKLMYFLVESAAAAAAYSFQV